MILPNLRGKVPDKRISLQIDVNYKGFHLSSFNSRFINRQELNR